MIQNISTDLEYSGDSISSRGQGSILSLGSCELGNINNTFYSEIKPINDIYNDMAMSIVTPGFQYIGETKGLGPQKVLQLLREYGDTPEHAFGEYQSWLEKFTNVKLREIACPIKFDGGLSAYYFREYADKNPLSYSGEDGNSMLRGFLNDQNMSFDALGIQGCTGDLPHNSLTDAQIQSIWIEFLLKLMNDNKESQGELVSIYLKKGVIEFLTSPEVSTYVEWMSDSISTIKSTPFGEKINYQSIL